MRIYNMKRILFLDDMQTRHEVFMKWCPPSWLVTKVHTAEEAIDVLREMEFDIVCLDHDLAVHHYGKHTDDVFTGLEVVRTIVRENLQHKAQFFIHSMNPVGSTAMVNMLFKSGRDAIQAPFHHLNTYLPVQ